MDASNSWELFLNKINKMKNFIITEEQVLENYKYALNNQDYLSARNLKECFPDAFNKKLEVNKWYKLVLDGKTIRFFDSVDENGNIRWYGFNYSGKWNDNRNSRNRYRTISNAENWKEATNEEVETALENEVIKLFGKDWQNAKIEKCLVHGKPYFGYIISIHTNQIWNRNGCIYKNGVFAEPLKSKVISVEETKVESTKKTLKIVAGESYICRKTVISILTLEEKFKRGNVYYCKTTGHLTNEEGNRLHQISKPFAYKHFLQLPK